MVSLYVIALLHVIVNIRGLQNMLNEYIRKINPLEIISSEETFLRYVLEIPTGL